MSKNIRVDEEVMAALLAIRAQLEKETNRPASMNDAVHELIRRHQGRHGLTEDTRPPMLGGGGGPCRT